MNLFTLSEDIFQRVKNGSKRVMEVAEKVETEFKNVSESTKLESESIANIATSLEQMNSAAARFLTTPSILRLHRRKSCVDGRNGHEHRSGCKQRPGTFAPWLIPHRLH